MQLAASRLHSSSRIYLVGEFEKVANHAQDGCATLLSLKEWYGFPPVNHAQDARATNTGSLRMEGSCRIYYIVLISALVLCSASS